MENHQFSGTILHCLRIFSVNSKRSWHIYCNSQYRLVELGVRGATRREATARCLRDPSEAFPVIEL